jgi:hypothetical protein
LRQESRLPAAIDRAFLIGRVRPLSVDVMMRVDNGLRLALDL